MNLHQLLDRKHVIYDGGMGTVLLPSLSGPSIFVDQLNLTKPDIVLESHLKYIEAGADIITTNTFLSSTIHQDISISQVMDLNAEGVLIARQAVKFSGRDVFVAGSVAPPNRQRSILDVELHAAYARQIKYLLWAGIDILLLETQFYLHPLSIALEAARLAMKDYGKFVPVHVSFGPRTVQEGMPVGWQELPGAFHFALGHGADIIGSNCYPVQYSHIPAKILADIVTPVPKSLLPNAGYPDIFSPADTASYIASQVHRHDIQFVGGCCGTTPETIRLIVEALEVVKV